MAMCEDCNKEIYQEEQEDRIKQLQALLEKSENHKNEIVLFTTPNIANLEAFGVALYNSNEVNSEHLDQEDCEYGASLAEVIDKAIKRWS